MISFSQGYTNHPYFKSLGTILIEKSLETHTMHYTTQALDRLEYISVDCMMNFSIKVCYLVLLTTGP